MKQKRRKMFDVRQETKGDGSMGMEGIINNAIESAR